MSNGFLYELFQSLENKKTDNIEKSWTAKLLSDKDLVSKKIIEEAGETIIEITKGNREKIISESSDLLYHLFVGLISSGVNLNDIEQELINRTKKSGIEEKKSRK